MVISDLLTIGGSMVIVTIFTEVVKRTIAMSEAQVTRFGPLLAIVLGIATSVAAALAPVGDVPAAALTGLLAGAGASGIYSFTKVTR
jgi:hypothetical protein